MANLFTDEQAMKIKRDVDGILTKKLLTLLKESTTKAAEHANQAMADAAGQSKHVQYHYLKGGNAFSRLAKKEPTGDWDFQLIPTDDVYFQWSTSTSRPLQMPDSERPDLGFFHDEVPVEPIIVDPLTILHEEVLNILVGCAGVLIGIGKKEAEKVLAYVRFADNDGEELRDEIKKVVAEHYECVANDVAVEVDGPEDGKFNDTAAYSVGDEYRRLSEWRLKNQNDHWASFDHSTQRLILMPTGRQIKTLDDQVKTLNEVQHLRGPFRSCCKPTIYVNNTIAGFLLYRLALKYQYRIKIDGSNQVISVKSEVVDISIPRVGNPESYLSTAHELTTLRPDPGGKFTIPGWRYHLFENMMLLGEIELEISGSPHKASKRSDRAAEALRNLKVLNNPDSLRSLCTTDELIEFEGQQEHKKCSILPQVQQDVVCEVQHFAASTQSDRPDPIFKGRISASLDELLGKSMPDGGRNAPASDRYIKELMQSLPYLRKTLLAPLTMSDVFSALRTLLSQESEARLKVAFDGVLSAFAHADNDDLAHLDYPLAFVRIDIDKSGFEALGKALTNQIGLGSMQFGLVKVKKVKSVDLGASGREMLVTFESESGDITTHIFFRQEDALNSEPLATNFLACYERIEEKKLLEKLLGDAENVAIYRVKKQYCADLLLDYLQRILLIHIRYPIMELYRRLNEKLA